MIGVGAVQLRERRHRFSAKLREFHPPSP